MQDTDDQGNESIKTAIDHSLSDTSFHGHDIRWSNNNNVFLQGRVHLAAYAYAETNPAISMEQ